LIAGKERPQYITSDDFKEQHAPGKERVEATEYAASERHG